jgi:hypothetical protein
MDNIVSGVLRLGDRRKEFGHVEPRTFSEPRVFLFHVSRHRHGDLGLLVGCGLLLGKLFVLPRRPQQKDEQ